MKASFQEALLYSPGLRIAGGTDEIMRNIIAERVLAAAGCARRQGRAVQGCADGAKVTKRVSSRARRSTT